LNEYDKEFKELWQQQMAATNSKKKELVEQIKEKISKV